MSYARILSKVFNEKWAITPGMLASILGVLQSRLVGETNQTITAKNSRRGLTVKHYIPGHATALEDIKVAIIDNAGKREVALSELSAEDIPQLVPASDSAPSALSAVQNQTIVIFGSGILGKHLSSMEEDCAGGLSVDRIQEAITEAAANPAIKNIVLWLDTPGGVVTGIPATADLIAQVRQTKTIVAYCDSLCASAGMWIAAACDRIYCTRDAELGSIGVYSALHDLTAMYEKAGVKVELFKDGIYKAAGFPGTSLTDAQRADILAGVLETSAAFKADIRKYRGAIKDEVMQGQCFTGQAAIAAGLADDLVSNLDDVLRDLALLST